MLNDYYPLPFKSCLGFKFEFQIWMMFLKSTGNTKLWPTVYRRNRIMSALLDPEARKQLLEARFDGGIVENCIVSPPIAFGKESTNASSASTDIDNFSSPKETAFVESANYSNDSLSNSHLSRKENLKLNVPGEQQDVGAKRPLEFESADSVEFLEEKSAKLKKIDELNSPEKVVVVGKEYFCFIHFVYLNIV